MGKNYVVLDLEWNQSADGKENTVDHFPFEIIEIGAVRLDERFHYTGEFHRLIKPKVYPVINQKTLEVIQVDMKELQSQGGEFEDAIREFLLWCQPDPVFCTWGSMDLTELQRNMAYYGIPIPFPKPLLYYDVQKLYSLWRGDKAEKLSLDVAVEELGIARERPFHRALYDAWYTGRVMQQMEMSCLLPYLSVDYYRLPQVKEEELYLTFPDYSKYVSRLFETKEEAIADKTVTDLICCRCNRMLRKKIRWFSVGQKYYFSLGVCPEHGYVKGKIRMKHGEDGRVYVVKTMKPVDEDGARMVEEKREESKRRRTERAKQKKIKKQAVGS